VHHVWRNLMGSVYLGQTLIFPLRLLSTIGYQHDTDIPSSRIMCEAMLVDEW
jgi:hypothetical protein